MEKKTYTNGIVGIEEFAGIIKAMESNAADRLRAGLLFVLDTGRLP